MRNNFSTGFLRRHASEIALLHRLIDPTISVLTLYVLIRFKSPGWSTTEFLFLPIIFLLVVVIFKKLDLYRPWRGAFLLAESRKVLVAWFFVLCLAIPVGYLAKVPVFLLDSVIVPYAVITPILLMLIRFTIRIILRQLRKMGKNLKQVIIAGAGNLGRKVALQIIKDSGMGICLHGFFDDRWDEGLKTLHGVPVIGSLRDLPAYVRIHGIDIVFLALPFRAESRMREIDRGIRETRASLYLVPDIFIFSLLNTRVMDIGGIPVFSIFSAPIAGVDRWTKRIQDLLLAGLMTLIVFPLLLVIGVIIKLTSGGPVLFIQRRYGLNGEEVRVFKFRTMTVCEDGLAAANQAKRNDPRITKFGIFLRRTSLDELPQLFNVLRGEMSLVGPRPHPLALNEHYRRLIDGYMLRHKVKPGITGWAQVNGWRGETETLEKMQKRVEYDLEYMQNWSNWFDLKIIFLTLFRGFTGITAY